MKFRLLVPTLAALLAVSGCSSKKKEGGEKAPAPSKPGATTDTKPGASSGSTGIVSAAPLDAAKNDALWALAPEGTVMGAVAAPGSAKQLHSMFVGLAHAVKKRPLGAQFANEFEANAKEDGVDIFSPSIGQKAGIDMEGGAALFMVGENQGYIVLPVIDRAAFRTITKATQETIDGMEIDKVEDDMLCTSKDKLYICAHEASLLKDFGGTVNGALAKKVAALPNHYRGHAEVVFDLARMKEADPDFDISKDGDFTDGQLGIGSVRIGNGALTFRGWFQAKPASEELTAFAGVPTALSATLANIKPSSLLSARFPTSLAMKEMPDEEKKIGKFDLKKDIFGSLTGEIIGYTPQSDALWGRLAIGVSKPEPFKELINMGCGMAPAAGISGISVTPADGKCTAVLDVAKLPLPDKSLAEVFKEPVTVTVEAKADTVEFTFGTPGETRSKPISSLGAELASKPWNVSMWAEGMSLATSAAIPWNKLPAPVPAEIADMIKMGVWVLSHVYEVGMAGAVRDDGIHGIFHVGTYAGDAPEAYAAYQEALGKALDEGDATAAFADIRKKWPDSMAARGGTGAGSMMIAGVTGIVAAVAVPAFMRYQEKSMEAAAEFETRQAELEALQK